MLLLRHIVDKVVEEEEEEVASDVESVATACESFDWSDYEGSDHDTWLKLLYSIIKSNAKRNGHYYSRPVTRFVLVRAAVVLAFN